MFFPLCQMRWLDQHRLFFQSTHISWINSARPAPTCPLLGLWQSEPSPAGLPLPWMKPRPLALIPDPPGLPDSIFLTSSPPCLDASWPRSNRKAASLPVSPLFPHSLCPDSYPSSSFVLQAQPHYCMLLSEGVLGFSHPSNQGKRVTISTSSEPLASPPHPWWHQHPGLRRAEFFSP